MKIIVELVKKTYVVNVSIPEPDADNFMYAIEVAVMRSGFSERKIEEYILEWAAEIKIKKNGKS
jgi:hypothetical protein